MFIRLWHIYYDGFSHLPKWGKILIAIVVAKLLVLFVVFKFLLMPELSQYDLYDGTGKK